MIERELERDDLGRNDTLDNWVKLDMATGLALIVIGCKLINRSDHPQPIGEQVAAND